MSIFINSIQFDVDLHTFTYIGGDVVKQVPNRIDVDVSGHCDGKADAEHVLSVCPNARFEADVIKPFIMEPSGWSGSLRLTEDEVKAVEALVLRIAERVRKC